MTLEEFTTKFGDIELVNTALTIVVTAIGAGVSIWLNARIKKQDARHERELARLNAKHAEDLSRIESDLRLKTDSQLKTLEAQLHKIQCDRQIRYERVFDKQLQAMEVIYQSITNFELAINRYEDCLHSSKLFHSIRVTKPEKEVGSECDTAAIRTEEKALSETIQKFAIYLHPETEALINLTVEQLGEYRLHSTMAQTLITEPQFKFAIELLTTTKADLASLKARLKSDYRERLEIISPWDDEKQ